MLDVSVSLLGLDVPQSLRISIGLKAVSGIKKIAVIIEYRDLIDEARDAETVLEYLLESPRE